ncbi:MAG: helix-turn-helix transcriptional regulator [Bacteroidetes bacterium]|nr:helix-turn-helix transcriptional regulator [Bacteroidota bacterium]MBS1629348.1 helix-turn-helix transcriptional regulator [Bacteroidota bacterium]
MTQTELAFRCNDVDYSQISRIELGKVNCSLSYIDLVAEALDLDIHDLVPRRNQRAKSTVDKKDLQ